MRTKRNDRVRRGDVIQTVGTGNAPGAGGVISTVIVTDPSASPNRETTGGFECRDATPAEVRAAKESGRFRVLPS